MPISPSFKPLFWFVHYVCTKD